MKNTTVQKSYIEAVREDAEEMICLLKKSSKEDKRELIGYIRGFFAGKESTDKNNEVKQDR